MKYHMWPPPLHLHSPTHLPLDEILIIFIVLPPLPVHVLINVPPLRKLDPVLQLGQIYETVVVRVDLVHDNAAIKWLG